MDSGAAGDEPERDAPQGRRTGSLPSILLTALLLGGSTASGPAVAQDRPALPRPDQPAPKVPSPARPATPDRVFEAAKSAFEALTEAERKAVQDALVWTGDFNAVVSGAFGRRTFDALTAYRARTGVTDPLEPRGRAALLGAGEAAKAAARFRIAADPGSGAVIGVPERLLSKRSAQPAGTRWQSADGRVTLETRAFPPGTETLDSLFDQATAPLPARKVTYKLRRPDALVVTAETASGLSYIRYAAGAQGVRGFLFGYDRALAPEVGRLVIAVSNAFEPFPAPATAPPAPAPAGSTNPAASLAASAAGAGLVVAPGRVLTASAALEGCPGLRVGSAPARVLATDPSGLALLDAPGAPAPLRPASRTELVSGDDGLIALAPGPDGILAAPGSAIADDIVAALQPGSAGAPVLDRSGRLVGLVARYPAAPRLVAGIVPPARLPLVPARTITAFLAGQGLADGNPHRDGGPGAVAPSVVALTCR